MVYLSLITGVILIQECICLYQSFECFCLSYTHGIRDGICMSVCLKNWVLDTGLGLEHRSFLLEAGLDIYYVFT